MRAPRLRAMVCARGHAFLHEHDRCPLCQRALHERWIAPLATLVLDTTVRINPGRAAFDLGIAVTRAGRARTICHVEGSVRRSGHDAVVLEWREGVVVARALRGRSRA